MHKFLWFRFTNEQICNFIIVISIIAIFVILFIITKRILINYIKKTSEKYKNLSDLNSKYEFHQIPQTQKLQKIHKTKKQFDNFNYSHFIISHIEQNINYYKSVIEKTQENTKLFELYNNELSSVLSSSLCKTKNYKIPHFLYTSIEKAQIRKATLKPVLTPKIICINKYISPKGQNAYVNKMEFLYSQVFEMYNIACSKLEFKETKEYQRKLMSPSLRYDILKRDGFKCVICGSTSEDGIKLHVDHITPVSKGGKTVPENLRTLCDSCNLGKSDKYDENGLN